MTTHTTSVAATVEPSASRSADSFVLSRPDRTVTASGVALQFEHTEAAAAALRSGEVEAVVGALPFSRRAPSALTVPHRLSVTAQPWAPPDRLPDLPTFDVGDRREGEHLDRVRTALTALREASTPLKKVVLARTLTLRADVALDPRALLCALIAGTPSRNGYYVDLSAAGGSHVGRTLVGSSPEVLIRRDGRVVTCHPLAGSAPRHPDVALDHEAARALEQSPKDLHEHAFVVDHIRDSLEPFCCTLDIADAPTLTHTPQLWHLGTPIRGELRESATTALDLALALHPTPAVCGTPTDIADAVIDELEGDRGFYAGAVGWCRSDGDGEWVVSIRCAEISADGRRVTAYAGGGIVAESEPESELAETITKFGTVLQALRVQL